MADPIYATPMVDPQLAINQLGLVYTSDHLTENYNTFFNQMTESERLSYMPEGYEGQMGFDPFQSDYGLDFKSTLESEGFVNYIKNKPVRAEAETAAGPTVTVGGGVLSAEELRRRRAGPVEGRVVYKDEVLPFYAGQEEGEGSVFDYWKSIPNISSFSEGLRGSLYGVSQPEKEEEEAAPVAQAAAQRSRAIGGGFGRDPRSGPPDTASYADFQSGLASIVGMADLGQYGIVAAEAHNVAYNSAIAAGKTSGEANAIGQAAGLAASQGTSVGGTPGGTPSPGTAGAGVVSSAAGGGFGLGMTASGGVSGGEKKGGRITAQMNNLKKGGLAVAEPNKDASWFIRELQSKEGSDVQVLKDDGKLVGAIDMNDPNRHFIIDMVDFDTKLGIIQPHERAMAADPRAASQLAYKRNWDARMQKLLEIQEMQPGRAVTETVPPVASVPDKQDTGVMTRMEHELAAAPEPAVAHPSRVSADRFSPQPDMEITRRPGLGPVAVPPLDPVGHGPRESAAVPRPDPVGHGIRESATERYIPKDQRERLAAEEERQKFRESQIAVEQPDRPFEKYPSAPSAAPTTLQKAKELYEGLMRERLETESGVALPAVSDAGPYPIRRAEPFVSDDVIVESLDEPAAEPYIPPDQREALAARERREEYRKSQIAIETGEPFVESGPSSAEIVQAALDYPPEDYFNEIVRPLEFGENYYNLETHYNKETNQYIGYLDSIQEKEKQDAEEKGEVYTPTLTTFGPGFTVTGDHVGVGMSKDDVEEGALDKWEQAIESSKKLLENDDHPSAMVLAEMIYQMGERKVSLFKDMLAALIARNGKQAKKHALYNKDGNKTKWHSQMENSGRAVAVADRLEESLSSDKNLQIIIDPKNLQVGGQVPQINRSGLIQGEGGPTSDSIPMQAEPNSFIINAPAVQMAGGAEKLDNMVQQQQQTSGFNQFGNPVTGSQGINVSNGEYKVSQPAAKKIGYKKLNKMNDAGKPFVDQLDQRGYAEGDVVRSDYPLRGEYDDQVLSDIFTQYPKLKDYDFKVIDSRKPSAEKSGKQAIRGVQRGAGESRIGQLEFYHPDEPHNPTGKPLVEVFNSDLQGEEYTTAIFGDMLHYLPSVDKTFSDLRNEYAATLTEEQKQIDINAFERAKAEYGESRDFDSWFDTSRLDAHLRGYLAPDRNDEWRESYTEEQKILLEYMKKYLQEPVNLLDIPPGQQKDSFVSGPTRTLEDFYPDKKVKTGEKSFRETVQEIQPMN